MQPKPVLYGAFASMAKPVIVTAAIIEINFQTNLAVPVYLSEYKKKQTGQYGQPYIKL